MGKIVDITNGHIKEVLNINESLKNSRMEICKKCQLYVDKLGGICSNSLWINPDTEEISTTALFGWVRGCGCRLRAKTRNTQNHCVINKW